MKWGNSHIFRKIARNSIFRVEIETQHLNAHGIMNTYGIFYFWNVCSFESFRVPQRTILRNGNEIFFVYFSQPFHLRVCIYRK